MGHLDVNPRDEGIERMHTLPACPISNPGEPTFERFFAFGFSKSKFLVRGELIRGFDAPYATRSPCACPPRPGASKAYGVLSNRDAFVSSSQRHEAQCTSHTYSKSMSVYLSMCRSICVSVPFCLYLHTELTVAQHRSDLRR